MKNSLLILCIVLLSSCADTIDKLKRVGKAPHMSQMELPIDESLMQGTEEDTKAQRVARTRRTNSLWQPGATTFFRDNRAWKVGDILKVSVLIQDSAKLNSSTNQSRNGADTSGLRVLFGKEKPIAKTLGITATTNTLDLISNAGTHKYAGNGDISRKESINTIIAAVVTQILPNGNLVIQGHQEVRVNNELREVKVAGIIRSKDVSADNSIKSEQIAEARISYGGRGLVSDMQQPRAGSQIVDIIAPF